MDFLGRWFAQKWWSSAFVKLSFIVTILMDLGLIYWYKSGAYLDYPILSTFAIIFGSFIQFRTALSISYFNIETNKKSNGSDSEEIGVLMTNALLMGIALGCFSANIYILV